RCACSRTCLSSHTTCWSTVVHGGAGYRAEVVLANRIERLTIPDLPEWAEPTVSDYIQRLQTQRRLSEHTVAAYRSDLAQFFDYCARYGVESVTGVDR